MNALKKRWQILADRIDALSLRERSMIFLAAAVALISLMNLLLIDPLLAHQKRLSARIVERQLTTATMQKQIQSLLQLGNRDPDAALKIRLTQLRLQAEQSSKTLGDIQSRLVSPQQMPALLEDLLRQNKNVHLLALKTLPVEALNTQSGDRPEIKKTSPPSTAAHNESYIYKHGVELKLSGNYFDLVHYLNALENLPWRMFWGTAQLSADDDHALTLILRVYTLSQDQAWLST